MHITIEKTCRRKVKFMVVCAGGERLPAVSARHVSELLRARGVECSMWYIYNLCSGNHKRCCNTKKLPDGVVINKI